MQLSPPDADARSVSGKLEIGAGLNARGETVLRHQYHSVPFHLSKAYWDGQALLVQVVNPTAGIFQGDYMESRVVLDEGTSVLITSPSAARTHTQRNRGEARADDALLEQSFDVAGNSWLEVFPELLIPQTGSVFRQKTEINVAEGGELYFVEMLAPGRLAHGESLAYDRLEWSFVLNHHGRPAAIERARVEPPQSCWMLQVPEWEQAFYGAAWIVSPALKELPESVFTELEDLAGERSHLGVSRVSPEILAIKILSESSRELRQLNARVRELMTPFLPRLRSTPRKL